MKIIKADFAILPDENGNPINGVGLLKKVERVARVCYKSEGVITENSYLKIVKKLIDKGHWAMIEHAGTISVAFIVDRGVTHEMVRHRMSSFAQESTRWCNYSLDKFDNELTFIDPGCWKDSTEKFRLWYNLCAASELAYLQLLALGAAPQEARSVLPNSLKSEIVITANLREWCHILKLRTALDAHPAMRAVMCPLLSEFKREIPVIFDGI